jgi:hypothetical protein
VAELYGYALVAGIVPASLELPGGITGHQRVVRITREAIGHIAWRHRDWLIFCLNHMADALARPEYLGYRPTSDPRRVEFLRRVGPRRLCLLVAVKFLDQQKEAWVSTAHPMGEPALTRRLRAGTMQQVGRGP